MRNEVLQRVSQSGELFDLLVQLDDMFVRQCFNVGARSATVLPQGEQLADLFQGNPRSRERLMKAKVCRSLAIGRNSKGAPVMPKSFQPYPVYGS